MRYHYTTVWIQNAVTPTKIAGIHLLSGHFKFRKREWKILATFVGMFAKLQKASHACPSIHLHGTTWIPLDTFS
jgi:hypothetical protein